MKYWEEEIEAYSPEELAEREDYLEEQREDRRIIEAAEAEHRKGANNDCKN